VEDGFAERRHFGQRQGLAVYREFPDGRNGQEGKISAAEFKTGCGKGGVQTADTSTTKDMIPPAKL
jgi:hypothetical protein